MNRAAILRTADWIEANPDKLIAGEFAISEDGRRTDPTGKHAVCFCTVGRLVHETGVKATVAHERQALFPRVTGLSFEILRRLTQINDEVVNSTLLPGAAARKMAAYLRKLAA